MISSRPATRIQIVEDNSTDPPFISVLEVSSVCAKTILMKYGELKANDLVMILEHLNVSVDWQKIEC